MWRIEQVERLACERAACSARSTLEPYDYTEEVLTDGGVRLAARALVTEADLEALSRIVGPVEVVRRGHLRHAAADATDGYVWGERLEGLVVVLACEDVARAARHDRRASRALPRKTWRT